MSVCPLTITFWSHVCDWSPPPLLFYPPPPFSLKERMRLEREAATRLLEEETEVRLYAPAALR